MTDNTERKKLLSDEEIRKMTVEKSWPPPTQQYFGYLEGGKMIRDFYEAKITSGELIVVKITRMVRSVAIHGEHSAPCLRCEQCDSVVDMFHRDGIQEDRKIFCPVCGAKIVE